MDQLKQQNIQKLKQMSRLQFCKIATKISFLISLLFILFSCPQLLDFISHLCMSYTTRFSKNLFNHSNERNYIFLLCNGILAVIITSSGLVSSSPDLHLKSSSVEKKNDSQQLMPKPSETRAVNAVGVKTRGEEDEKEGQDMQNGSLDIVGDGDKISSDEGKQPAEFLAFEEQGRVEVEEQKEEEEEQKEEEEEQKEDDDDEEESGSLSREELNKKCEEFIRKMKEGMKFDSRRQLVMV